MPLTPLAPLDRTSPTFRNDVDTFFATKLPLLVGEVTATESAMSAYAAGGAYSVPFIFDGLSQADGDPGPGKLRLSSAAQNASTTLRLDLSSSGAQDYTGIIDTFDASTSSTKGSIRLVKQGDPSKWLTFDVTARAAPAGYRNLTVVNTGGSSASPFVNGDALMLFFQRSGDKGSQGIQGTGFQNLVVISTTGTWQPPAGTTKAEVTVIDGGWSGGTVTSGSTSGGKGGDAGISIITVDPLAVYTATVGAGGAGAAAGTNSNPVTGGSSSFSGSGITTLTSANAVLKVSGGQGVPAGSGYGSGGGSLYAPSTYLGFPTGYGGGGPGAQSGGAGYSGRAGAIVIRY